MLVSTILLQAIVPPPDRPPRMPTHFGPTPGNDLSLGLRPIRRKKSRTKQFLLGFIWRSVPPDIPGDRRQPAARASKGIGVGVRVVGVALCSVTVTRKGPSS